MGINQKLGLFSYQIQYQRITKTRTNPENIWSKIKKAPFLAWRRFLPVNDWDSNILSAIKHTNVTQKKKKKTENIAKTVEKCQVPEMKVEGEEEEAGRPIKR